jgi:hypothetical protein
VRRTGGGLGDKTELAPIARVDAARGHVLQRARLHVARNATDAADCRWLLDMLGIGPTDAELTERRGAVDPEVSANTVIQAEEERT